MTLNFHLNNNNVLKVVLFHKIKLSAEINIIEG